MLRSVYIASLFSLLLFSCGTGKSKEADPGAADFFPVKPYLLQQLHRIDSLSLPTTLIRQADGRSDTLAISAAECREMATPFLEPDISTEPLKSRYKETSFADQSIPSITFTYTTADSSLPLKRTDVVLKPDPVMTDQVKSIYMEKLYQVGDTLVTDKLFWKADHYYQVISSRQWGENTPRIRTMKVVWDLSE